MQPPRIEFVAFRPQHLRALRLQAWQASVQASMTDDHGREIAEQPGRTFTALLDGAPVFCGGAIELLPTRAYAWTYFSDEALRHIRAIHRYALLALSKMPWRRIEAYTDVRHTAGARWLLHLGFQFEGIARAWAEDGRDMRQFARVQPWTR